MVKRVIICFVPSFWVLGRSQAALCSLNGKLIAVGGGDSWQCLNTVEVYDPSENKWTYLTPMATARRGAGVAVFKGQLYLYRSGNCLSFSREVFFGYMNLFFHLTINIYSQINYMWWEGVMALHLWLQWRYMTLSHRCGISVRS